MGADTVVALNMKAVRKYTRSLSAAVIDRLDNEGVNIVQLAVPNGDSDHLHVHMMLKLEGRDEPVLAWLDIGYADFNKLAEIEQKDGEYVVTKAAE
jgi:hypothetical protein